MATLTTLPNEILDLICSHADHKSRRLLRLTCLIFASIGRPWVFQKVVIRPNAGSYERLNEILANPDIWQAVREVYLDIRRWNPYYNMEAEDDYEYDDDSEFEGYIPYSDKDNHQLPEKLMGVFTQFLKSPKLSNIALRFHDEVIVERHRFTNERQHRKFRENVIKQVMLCMVSSAARLPIGLAIQDLHCINAEDPDVAAAITKVLGGGLQSLRLNIANQHGEVNHEVDFALSEPHEFHAQLPSIWIKPTMSSLRHLTIYSSLFFSYYPKFDLRGIHLPHLRTLSFGNHCFVHDSQLDWILSHGSTLTELYLDDCPILFEVSINDKDKARTYLDPQTYRPREELANKQCAYYTSRWSDYFRAFEQGLPHLRHFRYGRIPHWWEEEEKEELEEEGEDKQQNTPFESETEIKIGMYKQSYMVFCDGLGVSSYKSLSVYHRQRPDGRHIYEEGEAVVPSEEDHEALIDLYAKIGQEVEYYWMPNRHRMFGELRCNHPMYPNCACAGV